ncbi:MAG: LVIVD repeat-containing protein [Promethearchaeota archaeon]
MRNITKLTILGILIALVFSVSLTRGEIPSFQDGVKQQQIPQFEEIAHISSTGGDTFETQVIGDIAYVIDMNAGFKIYNVSDPSNPILIGQFYDGGIPHEFFIDGNLAYIADHHDGLEILNISDPSSPAKLGQITDTGDGEMDGVFVADNRAYVAEWHDSTWSWKMIVINVTDPTNPIKLGEYTDGEDQFLRFHAVGDICYTACLSDGLKVLNISDPTNILEIGRYSDGGYAFNFQIVDNIAFMADGGDGLELIDISDPANPAEIGQFDDIEDGVADVQVVGEVAYIAENEQGLGILDISNPAEIIKLGQFDTEDIIGVYVHDDLAFLSLHEHGLKIIRIHWFEDTSTATSPSFELLLVVLAALTTVLIRMVRKGRKNKVLKVHSS